MTRVQNLPEATAAEEASRLIKSKLEWIYQRLANHEKPPGGSIFRRPEFVDGEGFYFLGRHYRLKLVDPKSGEGPFPTVRFEGDRLFYRREQVAAGEKRIAEY